MRRVIKIEPFLYSADKLRKCIVQRNNIDLVLYPGTEPVLALSSPGTGRAGLTSDVDRGSHMVARGVIVTDQVMELIVILLQ